MTEALLASALATDEINAVRRRCSEIKGEGIAAAAAPACILGLVSSDVVDDDP